MATRKELEDALRAADAAGNAEDARQLADALANFKDTPNVDAVKSKFDALPWYQKLGVAADDTVRAIANGATLGWADNLAGAMPGGGGKEEQDRLTEEAQMRGGSASTAAEILGMLLPASKLSQGVGSVTGMTARTAGESAVREGLAGAGLGAISTLSDSGDLGDVASGTLISAAGGSAGGILGSKAGDLLNWGAKKLGFNPGTLVDDVTAPMTKSEMSAATRAAYDKVDDLGTRYSLDDFGAAMQRNADDLNAARIDPELHPKASRMSQRLIAEAQRGGDMSPRNIDDLKRIVNRDVTGSGGESHMAGIMARNLDDFTENGTVLSGNSDEAMSALKTARDLNRRTHVLSDVEDALFKGENAASDRGDISALRTLLNNRKTKKGMSTEELDALKRVVRGDTIENILRKTIGNVPMTPIGAGVVTGAATGNPALGVLAGAGTVGMDWAAENAARKYTDRNIANLISIIAGGGITPSAARSALTPLGQAAGVGVLQRDLESTRRRKKKRKD